MREMATAETDWVSAHAFYQGELDRLVLGAVSPLVAELRDASLARSWFMLRYWDGGPHLRLRVLPSGTAQRAGVRRLIGERLGTFFADEPSPQRVDDAEYTELAASLAGWEGLGSYAPRLYPNNSVRFIGYPREHDRYGTGTAIQLVERHFTESSDIAARVIGLGVSPQQRKSAAAAAVLLAWFCCEHDPARLRRYLVAGGDDPAGTAGEPGVLDRIAAQMHALATRTPDPAATGTIARWWYSVSALRDGLSEQADRGALGDRVRGWDGEYGIARTDPHGQVAVVLDLCAHLLCNRLGIPPLDESALRGLAVAALSTLGNREA